MDSRCLCVRIGCQNRQKHIVFLKLCSIVCLPVCCRCFTGVNKTCNLINDIVLHIERYTLPPYKLWSEEFLNPLDMLLPDCMDLNLQFLQELLEQLEASITSKHEPINIISDANDKLAQNIEFVKRSCHKECIFE